MFSAAVHSKMPPPTIQSLARFGYSASPPQRHRQRQHRQAPDDRRGGDEQPQKRVELRCPRALRIGRRLPAPTPGKCQHGDAGQYRGSALRGFARHDRARKVAAAGARFSAGRVCILSLRLGAAACEDSGAQPLNVAGQLPDLFGRQPIGEGRHAAWPSIMEGDEDRDRLRATAPPHQPGSECATTVGMAAAAVEPAIQPLAVPLRHSPR